MSFSVRLQTTSCPWSRSNCAKASSSVSPWGKESTWNRAANFSVEGPLRSSSPTCRLAPSRHKNISTPAKAKLANGYLIFWGSRRSTTLENRGGKSAEKMLNRGDGGSHYFSLLNLLIRLRIKSSLCAADICPIKLLRSFPSSTHLATSWRSSAGTCRERVRPPSFQVS